MAETALTQYQRLESLGLWRETADAQRREVVVSFGAASLVLSDFNGTPLTHWSLAAVNTGTSGQLPVIYTPDRGGGETLEIDDAQMVDAISRVRAAMRRAGPHPGRLRWIITAALLVVFAALLLFWLPGVSAKYAARVLPEAKAEEIGEDLMMQAARLTGQPCEAPGATHALSIFERWLMPGGGRIHVVDLGGRYSAHLPDGQVLVNRLLIEEHAGPEVAAGFVLLELARMQQADPMVGLFRHIGTRGTLAFLASGTLNREALGAFARARLTDTPARPDDALLLAEFARVGLTTSAFAMELGGTGVSVQALIEGDPVKGSYRPGIEDGDWIALQGICNDG